MQVLAGANQRQGRDIMVAQIKRQNLPAVPGQKDALADAIAFQDRMAEGNLKIGPVLGGIGGLLVGLHLLARRRKARHT